MTTVAEIVRDQSKLLMNSTTPRLDTELLLAYCLDVDRTTLFREPERPLTGQQITQMRELLQQRCAGRPISQLTGQAEFYGFALAVNADVLIPRPDTETLVDEALRLIGQRAVTVVDVGTGSGAVAIAIATHCPNSTVLALDTSTKALDVARNNVARHGLGNVKIMQSDWLQSVGEDNVDIIVSNPPYVPSDDPHFRHGGISHEPRLALDGGADGLDAYRQLIPPAYAKLNVGGFLLVEHGYDQAQAVGGLLRQRGFRQIVTVRDLAGRERISCAQK